GGGGGGGRGGGAPPLEVVERRDRAVTAWDGASSAGGAVVGTYLHGLLANDGLRRALLVGLAARRGLPPDPRWGAPSSAAERYDRLADIVAAACDVAAIGKLVGLRLESREGEERSMSPPDQRLR